MRAPPIEFAINWLTEEMLAGSRTMAAHVTRGECLACTRCGPGAGHVFIPNVGLPRRPGRQSAFSYRSRAVERDEADDLPLPGPLAPFDERGVPDHGLANR